MERTKNHREAFMTDSDVQDLSNVSQDAVQNDAPVEVNESAPEAVESSNTETQVTETPETQAEKMLSQKEVQSIAAREKRRGYERGRQEALAELERQRQETSSNVNLDNLPVDREVISQLVKQEAIKLARQAQGEAIERSLLNKIESAREKYTDFDDKFGDLKVERDPNLLILLDKFENAGDMLYEMADDPEKFVKLSLLTQQGFTKTAEKKLAEMSRALKVNEEAKKQPNSPAPLKEIKPSSVGLDGGLNSVSDFMKQPWLRG